MAIANILKDLTEPEIAQEYGYQLSPTVSPVSILAFANDLALISKDLESVSILMDLTIQNLSKIDLNINPQKCSLINIKNGKLSQDTITLNCGNIINSIGLGEIVKYLEITFSAEIVFDQPSIIRTFGKDIDKLTTTNLLKPDQKLNIMNQYIWSKIIYSLQSTPLNKIPKSFLHDIDKIVRTGARLSE